MEAPARVALQTFHQPTNQPTNQPTHTRPEDIRSSRERANPCLHSKGREEHITLRECAGRTNTNNICLSVKGFALYIETLRRFERKFSTLHQMLNDSPRDAPGIALAVYVYVCVCVCVCVSSKTAFLLYLKVLHDTLGSQRCSRDCSSVLLVASLEETRWVFFRFDCVY
jgi:hypothetical protein